MSTIYLESLGTIGSASELASLGWAWSAVLGSGEPIFVPGAGRFGGNALQTDYSSSVYFAGMSEANCCIGAAIMARNGTLGADVLSISLVGDGGTRVGVHRALDGIMSVDVGGTLSVIEAGWAVGQWKFVEISVSSTGSYVVRIDGVTRATGTYAPATGAKYARLTGPGGSGSAAENYVSDVYIKNDTSFLGDLRVTPRIPTADAAAAWTPLAGIDNYAMVDEVPPDGDTSYVSAAIPATQDYYSSTDVLPGTILAVHAVGTRTWARKDDTEVREIRTNLRSNAAVANGATVVLGTSYAARDDVYDNNPDGGGAWDQATAEASEWGPEVVT